MPLEFVYPATQEREANGDGRKVHRTVERSIEVEVEGKKLATIAINLTLTQDVRLQPAKSQHDEQPQLLIRPSGMPASGPSPKRIFLAIGRKLP